MYADCDHTQYKDSLYLVDDVKYVRPQILVPKLRKLHVLFYELRNKASIS